MIYCQTIRPCLHLYFNWGHCLVIIFMLWLIKRQQFFWKCCIPLLLQISKIFWNHFKVVMEVFWRQLSHLKWVLIARMLAVEYIMDRQKPLNYTYKKLKKLEKINHRVWKKQNLWEVCHTLFFVLFLHQTISPMNIWKKIAPYNFYISYERNISIAPFNFYISYETKYLSLIHCSDAFYYPLQWRYIKKHCFSVFNLVILLRLVLDGNSTHE